MSVAVVGCGRSGTNLVLEILSGNSKLKPSKEPENKVLFKTDDVYKDEYLTKCDTVYFNANQFKNTLIKNPTMKVIWTIRDPRDMILSKIKRGQKKSKGGDGAEKIASDATPKGCIEDLDLMFNLYKFALSKFKDRVMLVQMEDVISNLVLETGRMCLFLKLPFEKEMLDFMPRMRNKDKVKRYKDLDKSQIGLWKDWKNVYDGFFTENDYPIEKMFKDVNHLVRYFGYEKFDCNKS